MNPVCLLGSAVSGLTWSILFFLLLNISSHNRLEAAEHRLTPVAPIPALPFRLLNLDGEYKQLRDYRGQVVVVNFWASWCAPCRAELPSMNRAWERLKSSGMAMLAINLGEDREAINAFLRDYPIDFEVLMDERGRISQRWRVRALPTTLVLNKRGQIIYQVVGEREWDQPVLIELIESLQSGY
ncbi:MAG: TlpA family protein disulfide reductase [Candidatus Thiodiazotropha weberae]|uniref:TlpA disulfide reductase family protein n=1 Tax=Candidatus Thiodiazotropha endoloripes TaxID=1818881 RepID=UPI001F2077FB|nr:TlpA disulfide reductase family protein [Candidatus Thiodiazotropha endoloripes]MCG7897512.1 TlpA family protein disulfide reductase [Candidatus Thiodiazotropha weberae]MCG7902096.1 TlpA family protein disulfide reductase [Candidatus Thiodiazotropha weberae]